MTDERWGHIIFEHDNLAGNIENVKDVLINPLIILESKDNHQTVFYYRYYKERDNKERYLLVLVKYLNGTGFIITSFFTNKIRTGNLSRQST